MSLLCFAVPMFTSVQLRGFLEVSIEPLLDATETSKHYLALCRVFVPYEDQFTAVDGCPVHPAYPTTHCLWKFMEPSERCVNMNVDSLFDI